MAINDTYTARRAAAEQAYQNAISQLNQKRGQLFQDTGLTADVGQDGSFSNVHADGSNQYGALQKMFQQHGQALDSARETSLGRGIGTHGLGAQATSRLRYQQGGETAELGQGFLSNLQGIMGQQNSALGARGSALTQIDSDQAEQAAQQQADQAQAEALAKWLHDYNSAQDDDPSDGTVTKPNTNPPGQSIFAPGFAPNAKKVAANRTGASANRRQGIFAIH